MTASAGGVRPQMVVFETYKGSFDAELARYGLLRHYSRQLDTNVVDFLNQIATDLRNSNHHYQFVSNYAPRTLAHEKLDLNVLGLNNRGRRTSKVDENLYLKMQAVSPTFTLQNLLSDDKLVHNRFCIDQLTQRWIIHLSMFRLFNTSYESC